MNTSRQHARRAILIVGIALLITSTAKAAHESEESVPVNQVLEWNQIFIDLLVATNTANSSSQRLGAIVHTAIFDAYNGIEQRYTPIFVNSTAPPGSSRRAAVVAAAYTALVGIFPSLSPLLRHDLDTRYAASLAALSDDGGDGGESRERGIAWGMQVAQAVLSWRATDGFSPPPSPAFTGGLAVGQWRPTGGSCVAMSAAGLAFTSPFVVASTTQFDPGSPRGLASVTYADDFKTVKALGQNTSTQRTDEQTGLAPFWEGNASVHWNQAANQIARATELPISESNRLFAVLNIAMADTAFTIWSAKWHYGHVSSEVTWRPITAIRLAETDGDPGWLPLVTTPCHPEYPAGHPSMNGAAAAVLLGHFADQQTFTLTTGLQNRTYTSISQARADGNNARVWGGMHYPSTVAVSDAVGEAIANYVNVNAMLRVHGRDDR
jgi:hypothetical protein